jgi:formylglycine-generating enzyme
MARRTKMLISSASRSPRRSLAVASVVALLSVVVVLAATSRKWATPIPDGQAMSAGEFQPTRDRVGNSVRQPTRLPDRTTAPKANAGSIEPTVVGDKTPPVPTPEGMVWIPPGRFAMGSDHKPFIDARPIHTVELDGFFMDQTPVTNEQFARFVRETGFVTVAERKPDPKNFPGVPPEAVVPGSLVFRFPSGPVRPEEVSRWWHYVPGACWKAPEGPGSGLAGRERHPVVHVCCDDAAAYAKWAGKRLPTEAEWEYAARGGLTQKPYAWGDDFRPGNKFMANTWQGRFPNANTAEDGWERTAPVGQYPPNGFGLVDMAGNVWQWCADWYRPDAYRRSSARNPQGPSDSFDPREPGVRKRVQRGGSFLCTDQYCSRYMPGGRGKGAIGTGTSHVGFRCVMTPPGVPSSAMIPDLKGE